MTAAAIQAQLVVPIKAKRKAGLSIQERLQRNCIPIPFAGCFVWCGALDNKGYGVINIGGGLARKAHRVSWSVFRGPIPPGMNVLHRCDMPCCINPDHLFLGTQADNVADMIAKGRDRKAVGDNHSSRLYPELRRGENHSRARLSEKDILAIRSSPMGCRRLAKLYGVTVTHINNIRSRKAWAHI